MDDLDQVYMKEREIQLYVMLSNSVNRWTLYTIKFATLTVAIHHGYVAIRHFNSNIAIGVLSYFLAVNSIVPYAFIFDNAYKITELDRKIHRQFAFGLSLCRSPEGWARRSGKGGPNELLRKQIKSVPALSIYVGSFHKVERNSTLIFISFVLSQLVALLVMV